MISLNLQKQIEYWKNIALSDFETVEILIEKGKSLHGLFFCHLTIEKILKAHYVNSTKSLAPKTQDLINLSNKSDLQLKEKFQLLLVSLMKYQLEGRYPEYKLDPPNKEKTREYLNQTKELLEWLVQKL
jgi:HEPN domain-containing protein